MIINKKVRLTPETYKNRKSPKFYSLMAWKVESISGSGVSVKAEATAPRKTIKIKYTLTPT
jgi:hypothetical protein